LTVKENCPPSWQGILLLVLGIFGLLLTLLIGQIWEPEAHSNTQGPGTRSQTTPDYKGRRPQIQCTGHRFNKAYQISISIKFNSCIVQSAINSKAWWLYFFLCQSVNCNDVLFELKVPNKNKFQGVQILIQSIWVWTSVSCVETTEGIQDCWLSKNMCLQERNLTSPP